MSDALLVAWARDHHAANVAALALARRIARENPEEPWRTVLREVEHHLARDGELLEGVLRTLGAGRSRLKDLAGALLERLGRLKLNGRLLSYSPLSRVVELEGLVSALVSSAASWRALEDLAGHDERFRHLDLAGRARTAADLRQRVEALHRAAAGVAFEGRDPPWQESRA